MSPDVAADGTPEPPTQFSTGRAARSTAYGVTAKLLGSVLGAVAAGFVARNVSTGDFGALMFGMAIAGLVGVLGDFGASTVIGREMAMRPQDAATLSGVLVRFRLLGVMVCGTVGAAAGLLVSGSGRLVFFAAYASIVAIPLMGLVVVPTARLRILQSQLPGLVQSVLWTAGAVIGALVGFGPVALGLLFSATNIIAAGLCYGVALSMTPVRLRGPWREIRALWRDCHLVGASTAMFLGYHKGDTVIVQGLAGTVQTALYTGAYRIIETANLVANTLFAGLIPAAARRREDPGTVRTVALEIAAVAAASGALVMYLLARPIVLLLYGSQYTEMVPVVAVGSIVAGGFVLEVALNHLLVASGVVRPQARLSFVTLGLQTTFVLAVAAKFGALGAITASAVVQTLRVGSLTSIAARHHVKLPTHAWAKTFAAAVVALSVHIVASQFLSGPAAAAATVAAAVLVGAVLRPAPVTIRVARALFTRPG